MTTKAQLKANEALITSGIEDALKTQQGRALFYWILEEARLFSLSYDKTNPPHTFFREGERNLGNKILVRIMDAHEDAFMVLVKEGRARAKLNERRESDRRTAQFGHGVDDASDEHDASE